MKVLVCLCILLSTSFATRLISSDEIENLFRRAVFNKLTDEDQITFQDVTEILRRPAYARASNNIEMTSVRTTLDCIICRSAFGALMELARTGAGDDELINSVDHLCVSLGIESPHICRGALELNVPIIAYIARTTPAASAVTFCGLILQSAVDNQNSNCPIDDARFEWQVELPPVTQPVPSAPTPNDPLNIVVLTDAHLDPLYEPFGAAACGEPTCCRKGQTVPNNYIYRSNIDESVIAESIVESGERVVLDLDVASKIRSLKSTSRSMYPASSRNVAPAGYWGDYRDCDTPVWAYDDVIDRIAETHKNIDAIYYIGDTIDHHVWETTYDLINDMNRHLIDKIRNSFGENVLVVPSIGNHESQPTNQFAPETVTGEKLNTTWLYDALATKWGSYIPPDAQQVLRRQGDFSVQVRPGLRAISLNNNVAYKWNWWLLFDPTDSKKHLDWLVEELYRAEQAGEKVHILTHIPPGVADLIYTWTREYNRIVNRFSSTIAAEFNGHTHSDEFKLYYNSAGNPINVAWGGGSATSYSFYNLNYKVATIDTQTFQPSNIVNYVYNLTEANLTPHRRPHWYQLYDMRNSFQLTDLSATSINELLYGMVTDKRHLLDLYSAFFSKLSDYRWPNCNDGCKLNAICRAVVTVLWERERCNELTNLFYQT